jgi:hypothetical protein
VTKSLAATVAAVTRLFLVAVAAFEVGWGFHRRKSEPSDNCDNLQIPQGSSLNARGVPPRTSEPAGRYLAIRDCCRMAIQWLEAMVRGDGDDAILWILLDGRLMAIRNPRMRITAVFQSLTSCPDIWLFNPLRRSSSERTGLLCAIFCFHQAMEQQSRELPCES